MQVTSLKPNPPAKGPPILAQVVVVPEIIKQPAGSLTCAVPDVVVPSVYVPSDLAVNVPVTLSEPEIVTLLQERGSSPASEMSTLLSAQRQA